MLIKMIDGGLENCSDNCYSYGGCPTCDYGSNYINEMELELTKYHVSIEINQMYEYALSQGVMMKLFLGYYDEIRNMTENNFVYWFKDTLLSVVDNKEVLQMYEITAKD